MTTSLLDQIEDSQIDQNKNYLEELVGEGKKFQNAEELAKGKYLADVHIQTLEQRMDELREEYKKVSAQANTAEKLEDLLTKLESREPSSRDTPLKSNEDTKADLDEQKVEALFQKMKNQEKQEDNFNTVMNKVKEYYGENFSKILAQQAKELELPADEVDDLARRNPKLFFKTFGISDQHTTESFQSPISSSVRPDTFAPKVQKRTLSYYQNLKKTNPGLYFEPKIAIQMDKDAIALGEAFFDV